MRSRAAFKLEEILDRDRLLAPGRVVVDLGAAPGGWSQVASRRVAPGGAVFALDLSPMAPIPGVEFLQGDFTEAATARRLQERLGARPVDLVLSDMAPNLSGVAAIDQPRAMLLAECALELAREVLEPRGAFLVKLFQGQGFEEFVRRAREVFERTRVRKPSASRDRSREVYLLGERLRQG